jgi:hypothetical protein
MILFYNPREETKQLIKSNSLKIKTITPENFFKNDKNENLTLLIPTSEIISEINIILPLMFRWGRDINKLDIDVFLFCVEINKAMKKLLNMNIKACIFETSINHHIHTSCLVAAAKLLGIPQIFLYRSVFISTIAPLIQNKGVEDREILDWRKKPSSNNTESAIKDFLANYSLGRAPEIGLKLDWINTSMFYAFLMGLLYDPLAKLRIKRKRIIPKVFSEGKTFASSISLIFKQKRAISFFDKKSIRNINNLNLNENYSLIVLAHFQPEASSYPEGGASYRSHISIILELKRLGFKGKIFYKEHPSIRLFRDPISGPTTVGIARSVEYYQQLISLDVELISDKISTRDILSNDKFLPVTITGTVAIERAFERKITLVSGYPWFRNMPGIISLADLDKNFFKNFKTSFLEKKEISDDIDINEWIRLNVIPNFFQDYMNKNLSSSHIKDAEYEFSNFLKFLESKYND